MHPTFHRDRFTWLAYLSLAFYAYFLNVLGPITPFLKEELRLSYTVSSLHFTAFAVGILLIGLGGHLLIERIGRWRSLWIGMIGISLSSLLLLMGRNPVITIGASFLMGLIGSLILAIIPAVLSEQHGERRAVALSEANVISSIVSAARLCWWDGSPIGWADGGWRWGSWPLLRSYYSLAWERVLPQLRTPGSKGQLNPSLCRCCFGCIG